MLARSCHQSIRDVARTEHNLICPNSFRSGWNVDYSKLRYRWSWASRIRKMDRQSYVGCGESRVAGLAAGENLLGRFTRVWGIIPEPLFENLYRTSCGHWHRPRKMENVVSGSVFGFCSAPPFIVDIIEQYHENLHSTFCVKELGQPIHLFAQTFAFVTLVRQDNFNQSGERFYVVFQVIVAEMQEVYKFIENVVSLNFNLLISK